ncbi:MAG TPA: hypothetical protein VKY19_19150 [Ktedonosporobacter sp.]|jgi:hypothetical protein|nr:hypothetical protein [Ktedonosporobacter sp.]
MKNHSAGKAFLTDDLSEARRGSGVGRLDNKTLAWAIGAVTTFTVISILGPILWERQARKEKR